MSKVYLDMDDVLVDFTGGLKVFNTDHDFDKSRLDVHESKWNVKQVAGDKFVVDCMNTEGFFKNLPMMEGAEKLWDTAGTPYVLTAWPKTTNDRERIGREKREWIEEYFGEISDDRFIFCSREDKKKYAWSGSAVQGNYTGDGHILVDDMESNIEAWAMAGGYGVLFRNMTQAISDLEYLLNKKEVRNMNQLFKEDRFDVV